MKATEGTAGEGHNTTHMEISESRFRRRGQAVGWRLPSSSTCSMELLPLHLKNAFKSVFAVNEPTKRCLKC
ncbi:hypothetical protein NC652_027521 [Populus alba x Populus x berolinensis]|nr:hypothetical protein NC652_027521 [Populus alba x Populus x berolinensis]